MGGSQGKEGGEGRRLISKGLGWHGTCPLLHLNAHASVRLERASACRVGLPLVREALRHHHGWFRAALDRRRPVHARSSIAVVGGDVASAERELELACSSQVLRDDAQRVAVLVDAVLEDRRLPRTGDQRALP